MSSYTPEEIAAYDAAFEAGVLEAWKRRTGLILAETRVAGVAAWIAAYPEGALTLRSAAQWAKAQGLQLSEGDLFLPPHEVAHAYSTFG